MGTEDEAKKRVENIAENLGRVAGRMAELGPILSAATVSLQDFLSAMLGGDSVAQAVEEMRCIGEPIGCGQSLLAADGSPRFEIDDIEDRIFYDAEWQITGLCPPCQDRVEALTEPAE